LEQAIQQRDTLAEQSRQREEKDRAAREVAQLRNFCVTQDGNKAIAALDAFLKKHPQTFAIQELQSLRAELIAKRDRNARIQNILLGSLSLLGALFILSILKSLLFKKRRTTIGSLPGIDKLDKAKFTDPLSLTAQDSQARVKNKTARIPIPDNQDLTR